MRGVDEGDGVPGLEETLFVEAGRGEIGAPPVAGSDVRPPYPRLELVAALDELELAAWDRKADHPRALRLKVTARRCWCRLGQPPRGDHRHLSAQRLLCEASQRIPDALWKACRRVEDQTEPAEEFLAQIAIGTESRREKIVGARHVEDDRRRHIAQVLEAPLELAHDGTAAIDIEGAAVTDRQSEVVVPAGRMVRRQPIDQDGWLFEERPELANGVLVRAQYALRVD